MVALRHFCVCLSSSLCMYDVRQRRLKIYGVSIFALAFVFCFPCLAQTWLGCRVAKTSQEKVSSTRHEKISFFSFAAAWIKVKNWFSSAQLVALSGGNVEVKVVIVMVLRAKRKCKKGKMNANYDLMSVTYSCFSAQLEDSAQFFLLSCKRFGDSRWRFSRNFRSSFSLLGWVNSTKSLRVESFLLL